MSKVEILCEYYYGTDNEKNDKRNKLTNDWDSFKVELISIRKKWFQLKENLLQNKFNSNIR